MADATSTTELADGDATPKLVLVASTIAWFLGIFDLLTAAAVGIPSIAARTALGPSLLVLVLGLGFCASGYLLRKRRRSGGVLAIGFGALFIVLAVLGRGRQALVGLALNALVLVLAAASWRHLGDGVGRTSGSSDSGG